MKYTASKISEFAKVVLRRGMKPFTMGLLVAAFLLPGLANGSFAQDAPQIRLRDIRKISVGEFGQSDMGRLIQERVTAGIIQSGKLQVVNASARPDALLRGSVSSSRELTARVSLLARGNRELWSREVQSAAAKGGNQAEIAASIAGRIVKQLLRAIEEDRAAR